MKEFVGDIKMIFFIGILINFIILYLGIKYENIRVAFLGVLGMLFQTFLFLLSLIINFF